MQHSHCTHNICDTDVLNLKATHINGWIENIVTEHHATQPLEKRNFTKISMTHSTQSSKHPY